MGNEKLKDFFSVLSTNIAENGLEFVSTMEGKKTFFTLQITIYKQRFTVWMKWCGSAGRKHPFYGVQWHPEVNRFQWDPRYNFPHSSNAVRVSSVLAEFFVNEGNYTLSLIYLLACDVPHLYKCKWTNASVCFQEGEAPITSVTQQKRAARLYTTTTLFMWRISLHMNSLISSERHIIFEDAQEENPSQEFSDCTVIIITLRPHI